MTKRHYFQIACHPLTLVVPATFELPSLLPSFQPFARQEEPAQPLFVFTVSNGIAPLADATEVTRFEWEGAECIIRETNEKYEVTVYPADAGKGWKMQIEKDFSQATAELFEGDSCNPFVLQNFLMMLFAFASAPHGTLMFHASVIRCEGKGYLFLGKSGTGKSTHTRLWLQHIAGSELLNDDNPIVRYYPDGQAIAYGSPWSGKTPCYRNEEAPIAAFVRLQQAPYNRIEKERDARAFASLLPSCSCLKQDEVQYSHICDTIITLATSVPVFKLECLPDQQAAEICYNVARG